jgi:hypothetical protein
MGGHISIYYIENQTWDPHDPHIFGMFSLTHWVKTAFSHLRFKEYKFKDNPKPNIQVMIGLRVYQSLLAFKKNQGKGGHLFHGCSLSLSSFQFCLETDTQKNWHPIFFRIKSHSFPMFRSTTNVFLGKIPSFLPFFPSQPLAIWACARCRRQRRQCASTCERSKRQDCGQPWARRDVGGFLQANRYLAYGHLTWPWKIPYKWRYLAGKMIYFYRPFSMAMLNN